MPNLFRYIFYRVVYVSRFVQLLADLSLALPSSLASTLRRHWTLSWRLLKHWIPSHSLWSINHVLQLTGELSDILQLGQGPVHLI